MATVRPRQTRTLIATTHSPEPGVEERRRTTATVGPRQARTLIAQHARRSPEWKGWLSFLDAVFDSLDQPDWALLQHPTTMSETVQGAPLLDGARIAIRGRPARRLIRRLLREAGGRPEPAAASLARMDTRQLDPLLMIERSIHSNAAELAAQAAFLKADPDAFASFAQLATWPVLQTCGRALAPHVPEPWGRGYCPICGAWPTLAELRGIERTRRLRCGRCTADWEISVLCCPFCGERDHRNLRTLLPEGGEPIRKLEVCGTCQGYMKTLLTLQALPSGALQLEDLESVPLDLAAQERGYHRPSTPGYRPRVSVVRARPTDRWTYRGSHGS